MKKKQKITLPRRKWDFNPKTRVKPAKKPVYIPKYPDFDDE